MTIQEFEDWLYNLENVVLTNELKETIMEYINDIK